MEAPKLNKPFLALAGLLLLVGVVLGSAGGYLVTSCQRQASARLIGTTVQARIERQAVGVHKQHSFDSTFFEKAGERRAHAKQLAINQRQYDSLRRLFPAAMPVLPAQPPRYRPK